MPLPTNNIIPASFINDLKKIQSHNPKARYLLTSIEYYQSLKLKKSGDLVLNQIELERYVMYLLVNRHYKTSTVRGYISTIKHFLKKFYAIGNLTINISELAEKVRILTQHEYNQLSKYKPFGYRGKITDLLLFTLATGCEYGKFELMVSGDKHCIHFDTWWAQHIFEKYKGKLPNIPKKDFDSGVKQYLKELNINRPVKMGNEVMPIFDMNTDLLIRNTFIYRAVRFSLPYNILWEMFEYDDFTRYFPAVACLNNLIIDFTMDEMTMVMSMMRLIINESSMEAFKKPTDENIIGPRRFDFIYQHDLIGNKTPSCNHHWLESLEFNLSEQALTNFMVLLHQTKKLPRLD